MPRNLVVALLLGALTGCMELPTGQSGRDSGGPGSSRAISQLTPNQPMSGLSGREGSRTSFRLVVPAGTRDLDVTTTGGSGDVDLVVSRGSVEECTSSGYDNNERCTIYSPAAGEWGITLEGYSAFSGVVLTARLGSSTSSSGSGSSGGGTSGGGSTGGGSTGGGSTGGGSGTTNVYSRQIMWHYVSGRKATVTVGGTTIGPVSSYHQSSGPYYPADRCSGTQEPSAPIYNSFQGQTWIQMAAFRTMPGVRYEYTVVWDDGRTASGSFTGMNAGYCGTSRIRR